MKREKYFKTGIGREFIKNIIKNLQLLGFISVTTDTGSSLRRGGLPEQLNINRTFFPHLKTNHLFIALFESIQTHQNIFV
nr:hypothetical protein [uncultured Flavobacterium sp.]